MAHAAPTLGEIRADAVYTLPDFQRITGLGTKAVRRARRQGLRVCRVGRCAYVVGSDWLAYLNQTVGQA